MEDAWFFNDFYEKYTVVPIYRSLASFLARIFDPEGIDGIVNGVGRVLNGAAFGVRTIQSGYLRNYALMFLVGVVVVLGFLVTR
jgi:NADH-quinone oxidoreductase subunit L